MILFEKIRWKNFLSTGNQFTEVELNKNSTTLIVGNNGAGKSTILDALCFVLFGKAFRKINKPQLINTTNEKDCLVEIELKIGSTDWIIRRGIKPNVFDIEVNGVALHKEADDRANQRILEENILKVNYKSFTQIVILGSSTFVPFMQLRARYRREVVEEILDIEIFSKLNLMFREKQKTQDETIKQADFDYQLLDGKIDTQQKEITLKINGEKKVLQIEEPIDVLLKNMGLDLKAMQKVEPIKAPMPGMVLKILVEPGQQIEKGQGVLILEAMKMENVLKSSAAATVKSIKVSEKSAVEKGAILVELV